MAGTYRGGTKWLRHRHLITVESVLVVGLVQLLLSDAVASAHIHPALKVLFTMAGVVGLFAGLFAALKAIAASGVARTHQTVQSVALPLPLLVIHAGILVGLFYLYAHLMGQKVWPLG